MELKIKSFMMKATIPPANTANADLTRVHLKTSRWFKNDISFFGLLIFYYLFSKDFYLVITLFLKLK